MQYNEVKVGQTILYPHQAATGRCVEKPRTIKKIIDYPETVLIYFENGGYGVANKSAVVR